MLVLTKVVTYSNRGGRGNSRRDMRAILPSRAGRIAIVGLGAASFGRRLVDGNGLSTQGFISLGFRSTRPVTGVCIGGNSHIAGKRGLTRLSAFHLTGGATRTGSTLRHTGLRLRSMLVKRNCGLRSSAGMPPTAVRLIGMGDKCSRTLVS